MADTPTTLDLSTVVERPKVRIDGVLHELRHPDEFSLVEQLRLVRQAKRVVTVLERLTTRSDDAPDDDFKADEAEYQRLVDDTCRAVLIVPDEVFAKLREEHKLAVNKAFTQLQTQAQRLSGSGANAAEPEAPTTTGESLSPVSAGSTAAPLSAG